MRRLAERGHTLALAESCTGGMVSAFLTEVPGSSAVLWGGMVVYSNQAKAILAGVDPAIIAAHGAVSRECVAALLDGALARSGAMYAGAVSGIAGPGGGSPEKPVGTVWIGAASAKGKRLIVHCRFPGGRRRVRLASCRRLLEMVSELTASAASSAPVLDK